MFDPQSPIRLSWDFLQLFLLLFSLIMVPIELAFSTNNQQTTAAGECETDISKQVCVSILFMARCPFTCALTLKPAAAPRIKNTKPS
jgi:hypothetical protein